MPFIRRAFGVAGLAVFAGTAFAGGVPASASTAAASSQSSAAGPVATPPAAPATKTTTGPAALGGQLSITAPLQLPVQADGAPPVFREADVTLKDVGGVGLTTTQEVTISASATSTANFVVQRFDDKTQQWKPLPAEYPSPLFNIYEQVTVHARGQTVERYRFSAATFGGSVDILASGAGAVHATVPMTAPDVTLSESAESAPIGAPVMLNDALNNRTDVGYTNLDVQVSVKPSPPAACLNIHKFKLEAQYGGSWNPIALTSRQKCGQALGIALPNAELPAAGTLQVPLRLTATDTNAPVQALVIEVIPLGIRYSGSGHVQVLNLPGGTGGSSATGVYVTIGAAGFGMLGVAAFFVARRRRRSSS